VARDRLPHAYLFHGVKGVGKTTTALALAQFLNCGSPTKTDSCGECRVCRRIDQLKHPDVHWIFPMAGSERGTKLKGSDRIKHITAIREARSSPGINGLSYPGAASIAIGRDEDTFPGSVNELRREAGRAAVEARTKVFVVTEAERMTREAANSLLKVLEEPPPGNLLVSRCQGVRFGDLTEEEIAGLLEERGGWRFEAPKGKRKKEWKRTPPEPKEAALAAALCRGSLTLAGELAAEKMVAARDAAIEFLSQRPGDPALHDMVGNLDEALGLERDKKGTAAENDRRVIERVLDFGLLWHGDLLRVVTGSDVSLANRDREDDVRKEAETLSVEEIRRRTTVIEEARAALRGNVYRPLVLYPLLHGLAGEEVTRP
jgi:DNA polymerase-3 subunit delta'